MVRRASAWLYLPWAQASRAVARPTLRLLSATVSCGFGVDMCSRQMRRSSQGAPQPGALDGMRVTDLAVWFGCSRRYPAAEQSLTVDTTLDYDCDWTHVMESNLVSTTHRAHCHRVACRRALIPALHHRLFCRRHRTSPWAKQLPLRPRAHDSTPRTCATKPPRACGPG